MFLARHNSKPIWHLRINANQSDWDIPVLTIVCPVISILSVAVIIYWASQYRVNSILFRKALNALPGASKSKNENSYNG